MIKFFGKMVFGFTPEAEKYLQRLDKEIRKRVIDKLGWLEENFDPIIPSIVGRNGKKYFKKVITGSQTKICGG